MSRTILEHWRGVIRDNKPSDILGNAHDIRAMAVLRQGAATYVRCVEVDLDQGAGVTLTWWPKQYVVEITDDEDCIEFTAPFDFVNALGAFIDYL